MKVVLKDGTEKFAVVLENFQGLNSALMPDYGECLDRILFKDIVRIEDASTVKAALVNLVLDLSTAPEKLNARQRRSLRRANQILDNLKNT